MELSKIVEEMQRIAITEMLPKYSAGVFSDVVAILKRDELQIPMTDALWITQPNGSYLAFTDDVADSMISKYCKNQAENILNGSLNTKCRIIDFNMCTITEIPAEEFLKTVDHLNSVTGSNETKISADNDPGLYLNSAVYADKHHEIEAFRSSNRQNVYCADSLYYVVDKDFDGSAAHDHLTSFSLERTIFVAAATVLNSENSSAFDDKVVDWAKSMLDDIPPSVVESAKPIDVKPEAMSDFILNKLIPTAEAEAARNAENTESEDTDGLDRF